MVLLLISRISVDLKVKSSSPEDVVSSQLRSCSGSLHFSQIAMYFSFFFSFPGSLAHTTNSHHSGNLLYVKVYYENTDQEPFQRK